MRLLGPSRALKIDRCIGPKFVDHLSARAARRAGHVVIIRNGNRLNLNLRTQFRDRREDCSPLRAIRHPVGSVLHVASGKDFPVRQQNCRANVKI